MQEFFRNEDDMEHLLNFEKCTKELLDSSGKNKRTQIQGKYIYQNRNKLANNLFASVIAVPKRTNAFGKLKSEEKR